MQAFTITFLAVLLTTLGLRLWLAQRQIHHIWKHRNTVPAPLASYIPIPSHQRAADYSLDKTKLSQWEIFYESLLLLGWTLGGGLNLVDSAWLSLHLPVLWTGVAVLLSVTLIIGILDLPFAIWRTFVIESHHGFNHTTPTIFWGDLIKQSFLLVIIGMPFALLILWLMQVTGNLWWLWVWMVWILFSLGLTWAHPRLIAPLFNQFTPLRDPDLLSRINHLLDHAGFRSNGIFIVDGSRRSGHGNAYFSGFGRNKRIVFYDTLLETLNPEEIEAVLAHELGHFKHRHVFKRLIVMTSLSFAGLAVLGWLMHQEWFYSALGIQHPSTWMGLLLFLIALPPFVFLSIPVFNWRSRQQEFQADI